MNRSPNNSLSLIEASGCTERVKLSSINQNKRRGKIELAKSTMRFVENSIVNFFRSLLVMWANICVINVDFLFHLRNFMIWATRIILTGNLYLIEFFIMLHILFIRLVYVFTGTKATQEDKNLLIYDSVGFLRLSNIHRRFWSGKTSIFGENLNASSNRLGSITSVFDLSRDSIHDESDNLTSGKERLSPLQTILEPSLRMNSEDQHEETGVILENQNGENRQKQHYFPFHNYKRQKKAGDNILIFEESNEIAETNKSTTSKPREEMSNLCSQDSTWGHEGQEARYGSKPTFLAKAPFFVSKSKSHILKENT